MKTLLILLLSGSFVVTSFAQTVWKADLAHSSIRFEVDHLTISTVTGVFSDFECNMESKRNSFDEAIIQARVKVNSISTENLARDKHLKGDDFFYAERFPTMVFESLSFKKKTDATYELKGLLTLKNVTKEVAFRVEHSGIVTLGDKTISVFKADFTINRFDYDLKWDDTIDTGGLVVGEDVNIKLNLELVKM